MSDDARSKDKNHAGSLSRRKRQALIDAAAEQAAARARKEMTAILAIKEAGKRTLSRGDVKVEVNLPTLGGIRSRGEPP